MFADLLLFAQTSAVTETAAKTVTELPQQVMFEWGRIQSEQDWLLPLGVTVLVLIYVAWMYRRDSVELHPAWGVLLTVLRSAAFLGLLLVYLQPQWRHEHKEVQNSRVILLVDTSLSMGLHDNDATAIPAEPSRSQKVIAALAEGDFVKQLRQKHDVVVMRFDQGTSLVTSLHKLPADGVNASAMSPNANKQPGGQAEEKPPAWEELLAPRGGETKLGEALKSLIEAERSSPVSGIVAITDGQQNSGLHPSAVIKLAGDAGIRIYTVGIGAKDLPANVRVSDVQADDRARPGDSFNVTVLVQSTGLAGKTVPLELSSRAASTGPKANEDQGTQIEGIEQVTLGGDGETVAVVFKLTPESVGRRTFKAALKAPLEDRQPTDNQQEFDIEIVDRKTTVLLFAGAASREYQFLRSVLQRDQEVVVDVLLQTGSEGISQDAHEILDEFPSTADELFSYDCIVAFDPDWRELTSSQRDLLQRWVEKEAGGLITIAGPVFTDAWVQDPAMTKIRELYPVEFHRRLSVLEDARYGSKEPWPLEFTRLGLDVPFLWLADSAPASAHAWEDFSGVFGHYAVRGPKSSIAKIYAYYSDPQTRENGQLPIYMAEQFFGAGHVFYMASGEMWRLRAVDGAYFERLYTQLVRHVSQARFKRGSKRGYLKTIQDRYALGRTVEVDARLSNAQLDPLTLPMVPLEIFLPDSTMQTIQLAADPSSPGGYRGQFTARKEGTYLLELPVPEGDGERIPRRFQVTVPDLERENPVRNDALLNEIADKTKGKYYIGLAAAFGSDKNAPAPLAESLRDQSRTETILDKPELLMDRQNLLYLALGVLCGCLCLEWLIRRLLKLA